MLKRAVIVILAVLLLVGVLVLPSFAASEGVSSNDFSQANEIGKYVNMIPGANYAVFDHWNSISDLHDLVQISGNAASVSLVAAAVDSLFDVSTYDGSLHRGGFTIHLSFDEEYCSAVVKIPLELFFGSYTTVNNDFFYLGSIITDDSDVIGAGTSVSTNPATIEDAAGNILSNSVAFASSTPYLLTWTRSTGRADFLVLTFNNANNVGDFVYHFGSVGLYSLTSSIGSTILNNFRRGYKYYYATGYDTYKLLNQSLETERDQIYSDGYKEGYDDGYYTAWDDFENLETSVGSGGIFDYCQFSATLYGSDEFGNGYSHTFTGLRPNFTLGGVYFHSFWQTFDNWLTSEGLDPEWNYVDKVVIHMVWDDAKMFDYSAMPLFVSGNSLVGSAYLVASDGNSYVLDASDGGELREFLISSSSVVFPVLVKQIDLTVGRPYDLLNEFSLYCDSELYSAGFLDGYLQGSGESAEEVYNSGYEEGYKNGFVLGKKEGLTISDNGDWRALISSVVEAPVNTFQGLFNFEILGLDMRAAFGSVLALCVVLLIIKKVVL